MSVGRDTVALAQVTQSLVVAPAGTNRLPSVNMVDISIKRRFGSARGWRIEPTIDLFNLLNTNAVVVRTTQLGPSDHRAGDIIRGRLVKFGLSVSL